MFVLPTRRASAMSTCIDSVSTGCTRVVANPARSSHCRSIAIGFVPAALSASKSSMTTRRPPGFNVRAISVSAATGRSRLREHAVGRGGIENGCRERQFVHVAALQLAVT